MNSKSDTILGLSKLITGFHSLGDDAFTFYLWRFSTDRQTLNWIIYKDPTEY